MSHPDVHDGALARGDGRYLLRFESLFHPGRGYAFPCDAAGRVDVATLADAARRSYLSACDAVGRDLAAPSVDAAAVPGGAPPRAGR